MNASTALDEFRRRNELQRPQVEVMDSERVRVNASDGLRFLQPAPATDELYGTPPYTRDENTNLYLWVIDQSGISYILEEPIESLGNAVPKHTNLTGGEAAFLGGELWFASETSIYINGGSGAIRLRTKRNLKMPHRFSSHLVMK